VIVFSQTQSIENQLLQRLPKLPLKRIHGADPIIAGSPGWKERLEIKEDTNPLGTTRVYDPRTHIFRSKKSHEHPEPCILETNRDAGTEGKPNNYKDSPRVSIPWEEWKFSGAFSRATRVQDWLLNVTPWTFSHDIGVQLGREQYRHLQSIQTSSEKFSQVPSSSPESRCSSCGLDHCLHAVEDSDISLSLAASSSTASLEENPLLSEYWSAQRELAHWQERNGYFESDPSDLDDLAIFERHFVTSLVSMLEDLKKRCLAAGLDLEEEDTSPLPEEVPFDDDALDDKEMTIKDWLSQYASTHKRDDSHGCWNGSAWSEKFLSNASCLYDFVQSLETNSGPALHLDDRPPIQSPASHNRNKLPLNVDSMLDPRCLSGLSRKSDSDSVQANSGISTSTENDDSAPSQIALSARKPRKLVMASSQNREGKKYAKPLDIQPQSSVSSAEELCFIGRETIRQQRFNSSSGSNWSSDSSGGVLLVVGAFVLPQRPIPTTTGLHSAFLVHQTAVSARPTQEHPARPSPRKRLFRPCIALIVVGSITAITSLLISLGISWACKDVSAGFTVGSYIATVGAVALGSIVSVHQKTCTCWKRATHSHSDEGDIELDDGDLEGRAVCSGRELLGYPLQTVPRALNDAIRMRPP
jgi:hypothetical protein